MQTLLCPACLLIDLIVINLENYDNVEKDKSGKEGFVVMPVVKSMASNCITNVFLL